MRFALPLAIVILAWAAPTLAQGTVTATCKDGSSWSGTSHRGACRGHGGVQSFGATTASTPPPTAASNPSPKAAPAKTTSSRSTTPVPGADQGKCGFNMATKVYHCPGDRWYGKTKSGSYMTESAAKAAGDRPDHGKACPS